MQITKTKQKLDNKTHFQLYPSDCIPPHLYGVIKVHKPEKNYPMRPVVSTIGTPPYGSSEYLVKIIQPTLNKNKTKLLNSSSFVNEAKSWQIDPSIIDILNNDFEYLKKRTKIMLTDYLKWLNSASANVIFYTKTK